MKHEVKKLFEEFTQDIKKIEEKNWLIPAITSHISHQSGIDKKTVENEVSKYFNC